MKARLIGETSCGFIKNRVYDLYSSISDVTIHGKFTHCICLHDKNSNAECLYTSIDAILNNWRIEQTLDSNEVISLHLEDIKNKQQEYNKFSEYSLLQLSSFDLVRKATLADSIIASQQRVIESLLNVDKGGYIYDSN